MEGVAGCVEMAVERGWIFASKGECGWGEMKSVGGWCGMRF